GRQPARHVRRDRSGGQRRRPAFARPHRCDPCGRDDGGRRGLTYTAERPATGPTDAAQVCFIQRGEKFMNDVAVSQDDRTMGLIAHLSALVAIGPLIVWLLNKDKPEKGFVTRHALAALNFVITIWLLAIGVFIVSTVLGFIPVLGWLVALLLGLAMMAVSLGALVLVILAAV